MTIGTRIDRAAVSAEVLPNSPDTPAWLSWLEISPKASRPPIRNQATEAAAATRNGVFDGFC